MFTTDTCNISYKKVCFLTIINYTLSCRKPYS